MKGPLVIMKGSKCGSLYKTTLRKDYIFLFRYEDDIVRRS